MRTSTTFYARGEEILDRLETVRLDGVEVADFRTVEKGHVEFDAVHDHDQDVTALSWRLALALVAPVLAVRSAVHVPEGTCRVDEDRLHAWYAAGRPEASALQTFLEDQAAARVEALAARLP